MTHALCLYKTMSFLLRKLDMIGLNLSLLNRYSLYNFFLIT